MMVPILQAPLPGKWWKPLFIAYRASRAEAILQA
jgi:hypothetical protein